MKAVSPDFLLFRSDDQRFISENHPDAAIDAGRDVQFIEQFRQAPIIR